MAALTDEAGAGLLDEAGAAILDEAGAVLVDITVSIGPTASRAQAAFAGLVPRAQVATAGAVQGDGKSTGTVAGDGKTVAATVLSRRP
jgi:hypothetical protein